MASTAETKGEDSFRELYPEIEPYSSGTIKAAVEGTDIVHEVYYEEVGNPKGKPALVVHGGPGGGCTPKYRQFFNPDKYRVVLIDQRGAGKSKPHACLIGNTTWDLVRDFEAVREKLGIEKWLVFGGSWGSTLSLAYSESHPERVTELVLRGIFMLRKKEIDWFYQEGASFVYPDAWESYYNHIPEAERGDLVAAYHKRLTSDDKEVQMAAAKNWSIWEGATSKLEPDPSYVTRFEEGEFAIAFARIECHYFVNKGFFDKETWLLDNVDKIRDIPAVIAQGRYDMVCPMRTAWDLHKVWPEADLHILTYAGHSCHEKSTQTVLLNATDKFAETK